MAEDYYKILGVNRNATKDELKKAFRRLAMKYHPDKNKGDKQAEERFKTINEAYAVLSNDEKKKQYDMFGAEGFKRRFSQEDIFRGFDFKNIFREFGIGDIFGGGLFSDLFGAGKKSRRGGPFSYGFDEPSGSGGGFSRGNRQYTQQQPPQHGEVELHLRLEEAVLGGSKRVTLDTGSGAETVEITIPRGIEGGQKLRLKGKGPFDPFSGQRGDLYCKIFIDPHPLFKQQGRDLVMEKQVKLTEMVLGGKVRITTIDNSTIDLKIPPHTKNNAVLRVKGKGMPGSGGKADGSLLVRLQAQLPGQLDDTQRRLFEDLARTGL